MPPASAATPTTITLEVDISLLKQMLRQQTLHISDVRCSSHQDKIRLQQLLLQAMTEVN
ncbi:hypothetical protein [Alteromonas confluentis]|uniref:hypothetical protein n=1 Tax=Alteromonas confluentis TaxID=1656094 RepID=UPI00147C4524|nr:hypothetical protein [Alteromonas confluentis]